MTCEICGKDRAHVAVDTKLLGHLESWLYSCDCPVYMLDEIDYCRRKLGRDLTANERQIILSLKNQKRALAESEGCLGDDFIGRFHAAKNCQADKKDFKGRDVFSTKYQLFIGEAKRINSAAWKYLYFINTGKTRPEYEHIDSLGG